MIELYLQRRWGGHILVSRERRYGVTIAAGSIDAVLAALRLMDTPDPEQKP